MQSSVSEGPRYEVGLLSELNWDPESGGAAFLCPIWLLCPSLGISMRVYGACPRSSAMARVYKTDCNPIRVSASIAVANSQRPAVSVQREGTRATTIPKPSTQARSARRVHVVHHSPRYEQVILVLNITTATSRV